MKYRDPWEEVGNAATKALYQYYSTRPNPNDVAAAQADIASKNALAQKYGAETQLLQQRADAPDSIAGIFQNIYNEPIEGQRVDENMTGPMPGVAPTKDVIQERFTSNIPDIVANSMRFSSEKPGDMADVIAGLYGAGGSSPEQLTGTQMGAGMDYDKTMPGFYAALANDRIKGSGGTRQIKINDAMTQFGVDAPTATKMVDGYIKLSTDPLGNRTLTDIVTGDMRVLEPSGMQDAPAQPYTPAYDITNKDLSFNPGDATGFTATGLNTLTNTAGQYFDTFKFEGPENAAQKMRVLTRDITKALSSNARPLAIEANQLMALVPQPFVWNQNPDVATNQVKDIVRLLKTQYDADAAVVDDKSLPIKVRTDVARRMNDLRRTIASVMKPQSFGRMFHDQQSPVNASLGNPSGQDATGQLKPGTEEDGYRFKGGDPADPTNWEKM